MSSYGDNLRAGGGGGGREPLWGDCPEKLRFLTSWGVN